MSEMTVGSIRTTVNPPLASGIYEALLEKAERERDDALERLKDCGSHMMQVCKELEAGEMDCAVDAAIMVMGRLKRAEKENEEQARLLGMGSEREARLITERDEARALLERKWHEEDPPLIKMMRERDHYKEALEQVSSSSKEWLDSLFREPSEDFVTALRAWIDKKLKEL